MKVKVTKESIEKAWKKYGNITDLARYFNLSVSHMYRLIRETGCLLKKKKKVTNNQLVREIYLRYRGFMRITEAAAILDMTTTTAARLLMSQALAQWRKAKNKSFPMPGNHHQIKIWKYLKTHPKPWINENIAYQTATPIRQVQEYRSKLTEWRQRSDNITN